MTQADLAFAADSSTRHLSYLETGRARPSREIVARLGESLDIPLRDRNAMLLAAGFAPAFQERSLDELEEARAAIEQVLQAHRPYPAFAVDRHWNVVLSNGALPQLYEGCSPELLRRPINAVRLMRIEQADIVLTQAFPDFHRQPVAGDAAICLVAAARWQRHECGRRGEALVPTKVAPHDVAARVCAPIVRAPGAASGRRGRTARERVPCRRNAVCA